MRSADERWKRLKKLYPSQQQSGAPEALREEPASEKFERPVRVIPAETSGDSADVAEEPRVPETQVASESIETALSITPRRPASPILPIDEEPAWIRPVQRETKRESRLEFPIDASDDGGVRELVPYGSAVPTPADDEAFAEPRANRTPPRMAALQDPVPPTPAATSDAPNQMIAPVKYRKMALISPFRAHTEDGRSIDDQVRSFAKKQTDELKIGFGVDPYQERAFPQVVKPWEAPNFFHYPLYFQDPALERYGHAHHPLVQPVASIGRFGTQLVFLPYQMTIDPPCREVYSLGWYRPGEVSPKLHYQVPLNGQAAAVQALTVTGLSFLIP